MLLSILLFGALAAAAPTTPFVVHEKRDIGSYGGLKGNRVSPDAILPMRIALTQSNLEKGYEHLMSVSHPASPNYGKHWTMDEIHDMFAPSEESIQTVKAWLESVGVAREAIARTTSRGWLGFDMSAADAERVFHTEYYEHTDARGNIRVGCDEYSLPAHVSPHVDLIKPGVALSAPLAKAALVKRDSFPQRRVTNSTAGSQVPNISASSLATCGEWMTPACIKALYSIPNATCNNPGNSLGVFEAQGSYDQLDLNLYFSHYAPWVPNGTHPSLVSINNATAPDSANKSNSEAVVDFDLALSLLYPQTVTLYQVNTVKAQLLVATSQGSTEALLDAIDGSYCTEAERKSGADCGTVELTNVLSTSYSSPEIYETPAWTQRACTEIMKLGLKGHTLLFSSGDYGVSAGTITDYIPSAKPNNGCIDAKNVTNIYANGTIFSPTFPGTCPYVTSVGATQLKPGQTVNGTESAMDVPYSPDYLKFVSSGGFSNFFSRPAYQEQAVDTWLKTNNATQPSYALNGTLKSLATIGAGGGKYNRNGRGFPDVSANGQHLAIFTKGRFFPPGQAGTSLSTPIFASIINMINEARLDACKSPVGFINAVLYEHPECFHDITEGSNPGCYSAGFKAVPGWDPVTGLGTPSYPCLLDRFMALQ